MIDLGMGNNLIVKCISYHNPKIEFPCIHGSHPREWITTCASHFTLCSMPNDQQVDLASSFGW